MKILIATPLYPPDIGGPATYSKKIADELPKYGIQTKVLSFGSVRRLPTGIRHFVFFLRVIKESRGCDVLFALDNVSVGIPAAAASLITRKPLIIRLGGDFLWEDAVERGGIHISMRQFYSTRAKQYRPMLQAFIRSVFIRSVFVIFSTEFQRDINMMFYGIPQKRARIVENPNPHYDIPLSHTNTREIIYAGRFIILKNPISLIDAVADEAFSSTRLVLIGEGYQKEHLVRRARELGISERIEIVQPISHDKLLARIAQGLYCVLPSFTDVSPNLALECIALKKSVIVSRETGLQKHYPDLLYIDPFSINDMRDKMKLLLDDRQRLVYEERLSTLPTRNWSDAARELCSIINEV